MKAFKFAIIFILVTGFFKAYAQSVYTTKTGEKYHKENCRYLKNSKKEITLEKALALGYAACSLCKPLVKNSSTNSLSPDTKASTSHNQTQKSAATQCTGKTKSGSRCKRMTKSADGRCYQH
ncbi:hypothetical protein NA63_2592 [Flavobacteriaceae bacterium MAR_2010_105]|nr:hypothetical protein NA63_2592 [Flavobacteriaceae bacterium MAR_2010_105]